MAVYDLDDIGFLVHDIDKVLTKINSFYHVNFDKAGTTYYPKRAADNTKHWTSNETSEVFNKMIPEIKGLHKDMYSIIESISKAKKGQFKKDDLEKRYENFRQFRLLNNKFKHFNNQQADINLTQMVIMESTGHLIDIYVNFKFKNNFETHRYCEFVDTFLKIMEELEIIKVER
jgi:hypothetical protein